MQPPDALLRRMTPDDIPQILEMFPKVGWNHTELQLQANIGWAGEGSFCLEVAGRLVGTANVILYGTELAWVGMVVVDPDYQRRGFARRLMVKVMEYCATCGIKTVMLDASEFGYGLYEELGFKPLYKIETWTGIPAGNFAPGHVRRMTRDDLPAVAALDSRLFGRPRSHILEWLADFGGWVDDTSGQISGYIFAHAARTGRIGPWHHNDSDGADALLQSALTSFDGQTAVRIDIPEGNAHAKMLAARYGLTTQRGCVRMLWGENPAPGSMSEQYAIVGFATG